jgi:hypothetical protein
MCRSLLEANRNNPLLVPHRRWFQVIVRLLRCCKNVQTIEVPQEWGDVSWYGNKFPLIDLTDSLQAKRQLRNGRWRWGKDPVWVPQVVPVVEEPAAPVEQVDMGYLEERSMDWE